MRGISAKTNIGCNQDVWKLFAKELDGFDDRARFRISSGSSIILHRVIDLEDPKKVTLTVDSPGTPNNSTDLRPSLTKGSNSCFKTSTPYLY